MTDPIESPSPASGPHAKTRAPYCGKPIEERQLLSSRRTVPSLPSAVDITVKTRCPGKWAVVDMETGEVWAHDGQRFARLSPEKKREVADVVNMPMSIAGT
jgi:hypothetical protein